MTPWSCSSRRVGDAVNGPRRFTDFITGLRYRNRWEGWHLYTSPSRCCSSKWLRSGGRSDAAPTDTWWPRRPLSHRTAARPSRWPRHERSRELLLTVGATDPDCCGGGDESAGQLRWEAGPGRVGVQRRRACRRAAHVPQLRAARAGPITRVRSTPAGWFRPDVPRASFLHRVVRRC